MNPISPTPAQNEPPGKHANGTVRPELDSLIAGIEEVLGRCAAATDPAVTQLRDSLRQKLTISKDRLGNAGSRITAAASSASSATDEYVRHHPWQTIGLAAMLGAAAGFLLARR